MHKIHLCIGLALCFTFVSCFKDEPLNAECDIEEAAVPTADPLSIFFSPTDTVLRVLSSDSVINFNVRRHADLTALAPTFKLTPGATINPPSGSTHDFSAGNVRYTVTSEDGLWHRNYQVGFTPVTRAVKDTVIYNFDNYELEAKDHHYYIWHNELPDGTFGNNWATGNPGFQLSMGNAAPEEYPSVPLKDGFDGACIQLTTRSTGSLGELVNKRIAAGNMFLGQFDLFSALANAMKATRFGIPFDRKPQRLKGWYKYSPGPKYQDQNGNIIAGRTDSAAIYAVFYRNHDDAGNPVVLYGDNVKTSPQIIAIADLTPVKEAKEWTEFDISFVYMGDIDTTLLENRGYNLTIVCSSSYEGDKFEGAIGSQLLVDKISVICEKEE